jgi:hypothetical protein
MFVSLTKTHHWPADVDKLLAELQQLREAASDLHKLTADTRELIDSTRDVMRVADEKLHQGRPLITSLARRNAIRWAWFSEEGRENA